jgi:hypothetical protein
LAFGFTMAVGNIGNADWQVERHTFAGIVTFNLAEEKRRLLPQFDENMLSLFRGDGGVHVADQRAEILFLPKKQSSSRWPVLNSI